MRKEQESLGALAAQLLALAEAHDRVARDGEAMDAAAQKFERLLDVESMEEAERRIDDMAAAGRLDPALLLTMAKAYAGAKETDITREEVRCLSLRFLHCFSVCATAAKATACRSHHWGQGEAWFMREVVRSCVGGRSGEWVCFSAPRGT